jgi:hypothetical protein
MSEQVTDTRSASAPESVGSIFAESAEEEAAKDGTRAAAPPAEGEPVDVVAESNEVVKKMSEAELAAALALADAKKLVESFDGVFLKVLFKKGHDLDGIETTSSRGDLAPTRAQLIAGLDKITRELKGAEGADIRDAVDYQRLKRLRAIAEQQAAEKLDPAGGLNRAERRRFERELKQAGA